MKKLPVEIWLPIISLVAFIAVMVCLRVYADTKVYTAPLCRHWHKTTGVLVFKNNQTLCLWRVDNNRRTDEQWGTCENYEVGDVIPWDKADYTCD